MTTQSKCVKAKKIFHFLPRKVWPESSPRPAPQAAGVREGEGAAGVRRAGGPPCHPRELPRLLREPQGETPHQTAAGATGMKELHIRSLFTYTQYGHSGTP